MSRISIEVTEEEHQKLKAIAAFSGKSIKKYVLGKTLHSEDEEESMQRLKAFLKPRIEAAERGQLSSRTATQILEDISSE